MNTDFAGLFLRFSVFSLLFFIVSGFTGFSCDKSTSALPGLLEQPLATTISGDHLFIASPSTGSLKVLDLRSEDAPFIRAPNPLFPLEIPVLRSPGILHALPDKGRELVVALSSVDPQMRLVDADKLVPLGLPAKLPGLPVGIDHCNDMGMIFVVTETPDDSDHPGTLVSMEIDQAVLEQGYIPPSNESPFTIVDIVHLAFRPGGIAVSGVQDHTTVWISDMDEALVFAVHIDGEYTHTAVETGEPVSVLVSSPEAGSESAPIFRGRYIYALTATEGSLISIDAEEERVADTQIINGAIHPLNLPSRGLGLTVEKRAIVSVMKDELRQEVHLPFLVMVSMLNGAVYYVDGVSMAPVDIMGRSVPEPSIVMQPEVKQLDGEEEPDDSDYNAPMPVLTLSEPDEEGEERYFVPDANLTPGITATRTWRISYRGRLRGYPAKGNIEADGESVCIRPEIIHNEDDQVIRTGDFLSIIGNQQQDSDQCEYSSNDFDYPTWKILSISDEGCIRLSLLDEEEELSFDCFPEKVVYEVRAEAYMVTADDLDNVWRIEPGETFEYEGSTHINLEENFEGPDLSFTLSEKQDEELMKTGAERRLIVSSGITGITAVPDTDEFMISRAVIIGQPSVYRKDYSRYGSGRLFVPYAGSGYLISFDIATRGLQRLHR